MRSFTFILLSVLISNQLNSQVQALGPVSMFQTTIYVKDALGHLDSVVLGYDTLAGYNFNPAFGEAYLTTPFDSVLDVRASHSTWSSQPDSILFSKKIVGWCEKYVNVDCYLPEALMIFVKAKYQPVTFLWDRQYIVNYDLCNKFPFLTPDYRSELIDSYVWLHETPGGVRAECMANRDSCQLFLSPNLVPPGEQPYLLTPAEYGVSEPVVGVAVYFAPSYPLSPCSLISSSSEPSGFVGSSQLLALNPNPAADVVQISAPGNSLIKVDVYDQVGRLVLTQQCARQPVVTLPVASLTTGLYFVQAQCGNQQHAVGRLVKM